MARDLSFWKYKANVAAEDEAVYDELTSGARVEGVEELPIKAVIADIKATFKDWEWTSETTLEKDQEMIELFTTEQFVRFDCYSVTMEDMNRIIDIMAEYECPLYDSSISTRFEL